ncbi:uncharacterized protein LOC124274572 [Haliotis rubra]|uniref:uncharacterized protein LOC124274572 n=1 Tax=Haliotis rubra TaxID=36100 RepID=UPI001EE587C3|nr:uncharacterized protein LOC124274572 [Haliotis rubra]
MMFGPVIFLLYLPAICFSFALFPNAGHETQRRQNPGENMVNVSSSQGEEDSCMELFSPCIHNLRHMFSVHGPKDIVVDGRLAVPCESNLLEGSQNCIDAASQCRNQDFYGRCRRPRRCGISFARIAKHLYRGRSAGEARTSRQQSVSAPVRMSSISYVCRPA